MDNASTNPSFLRAHFAKHRPDTTNFMAFFIRCFPHVTNVIAQQTIKALSRIISNNANNGGGVGVLGAGGGPGGGPPPGGDDENDNDYDDYEDYDSDDDTNNNTTRIPTKLLSKIRALVCTIRASGQHQDTLHNIIVRGNSLHWWATDTGAAITIEPRKLLLDVHTRWDSTFQMLVRLQELKQVH